MIEIVIFVCILLLLIGLIVYYRSESVPVPVYEPVSVHDHNCNNPEHNHNLQAPQVPQEQIKPEFIQSDKHTGSKPGYVFYRSNKYGLGYHLDVAPLPD